MNSTAGLLGKSLDDSTCSRFPRPAGVRPHGRCIETRGDGRGIPDSPLFCCVYACDEFCMVFFFEVACPGDRWGEWNRSLHSSCRGRDIEDGVAMNLRVQKVEGESRSPRDRKRIDEKDGGNDEVTNGIPCRRRRDGGERLEGLVTSSDGVVL